ncbi:putative cytochrome c class I protein [Roseibacterium elongatum DSM 19469]|uniref:Putative cytochrome c class I protein n=1 Tax=Roseicyclus elongatus DSM 19469 TaxID=1294273 RepID=W8RV65_9RHOB|nr:putative cytochrome c class I protein [Roseibacterium elongatum DSM 19469]
MLALIVLSVIAMSWAAMRPGDGMWRALADTVDQTAADLAQWYRDGPGDGHPDWDGAAIRIYGANADRGARAMIAHGCGACHTIPGVTGARGSVGPHLGGFADRAYVAGVLPNTPDGLVRWLVNPVVHAPRTAMPDLGVTEAQARDMAAYLYTLRGR